MIKNILLVFMLIMITGFVFGCTDSEQKVNQPEQVIPTSTIPEVKYDDNEYAEWFEDSGNIISTDLFGISESSNNHNLVTVGIWGKYLKEDSQQLLDEITQFNVSPSLQPSVDEYEKSLEKMYLAGKYVEIGAQENDWDDVNLGIEYMSESGILLQRSISLIPT